MTTAVGLGAGVPQPLKLFMSRGHAGTGASVWLGVRGAGRQDREGADPSGQPSGLATLGVRSPTWGCLRPGAWVRIWPLDTPSRGCVCTDPSPRVPPAAEGCPEAGRRSSVAESRPQQSPVLLAWPAWRSLARLGPCPAPRSPDSRLCPEHARARGPRAWGKAGPADGRPGSSARRYQEASRPPRALIERPVRGDWAAGQRQARVAGGVEAARRLAGRE